MADIETPPRARSATHPPATPERPARNRGRAAPDQRLYVPLKGVRRQLFGPAKKCFKCKHKVEERLAIEVIPLGKTATDAVYGCPRCSVCTSCWTMRPTPGGGQEAYTVDGDGKVTHTKCLCCRACGKVDPSKEPVTWETGMTHRECLGFEPGSARTATPCIAGLSISK